MYGALAPYYDLIYQGKDYRRETRLFLRLARRYGNVDGRRWLDVACGTGRHLEDVPATWRRVGVDASPDMLRVARQRLPGVRFVRADMRRFDLGEEFDVVSCLFSALGYLLTEGDLVRAFRSFARHLAPKGVLIVEPWIDPARFISGKMGITLTTSPTVQIARAYRSSRRGNRVRVEYEYLIAEQGRDLRRVDEVNVSRMTPPRRLVELLARAGLRGTLLPSPHLPERGIVVARRTADR